MSETPLDEKALFEAAVEIESPAERKAYLDRACGGNQELRAAVESLLQAHDQAGDFLETPAFGQGVSPDATLPTEGPGTIIGRYKLLEQIGEGGFAVVYMAEQAEPVRRKVALKIIKLGMDTKQVIGRFEVEQQALAMMDHPNIAKVLDGGITESGRPYFVMELVRGIPITEYCDENNLSTRQRLELFIDVCGALQHAHQKGIIHRDVKPSNVLVTLHDDRPVPKVIDFGVAKALGRPLTDKTLFTEFRQFVGTPEYMSPEQARLGGLDIDTRCDIYALGVLLYELLTGTTPFTPEQLRGIGYDEILRTIRQTDPPKPSTRLTSLGETLTEVAARRRAAPEALERLVRGDLDWIAMRCLEKDRTRRYETAHGLALDVRRHLSHEPVAAGPPGVGYRLRKFIRRHRTSVAAWALVAAALIVGLVAASVGFLQASHEREIARREAARATRAEEDAVSQRDLAQAGQKAADVQRRAAEAQRKAAEEQRKAAEAQRLRAQGLLAKSQLDRGVTLLNEGSSAGLLDLLDARMAAEEIPELRDSATRLWSIGYALWADRLVGVVTPYRVGVFSPDGKVVATYKYRALRLWDADGDRPCDVRSLPVPLWPYTILFSPDGKRLVSHSPMGKGRLFDAKTGRPVGPVLEHDSGSATPVSFRVYQLSAAFSPDSRLLATGWVDGALQLWRTDTCAPYGPVMRHQAEVRSVAFSPDGKLLASGSWDHTARLWDVATGTQHGPAFEHKAPVDKVVFSPEGQYLAIASGGQAYLYETATGRLHKELRNATKHELCFSPDGKLLGTCSGRKVRLWDAATGQLHGEPMDLGGEAYSLQFSSDGKLLVAGGLGDAWFLDTATTRPLRRQWVWHEGVINVDLSPNGRLLSTGNVNNIPRPGIPTQI